MSRSCARTKPNSRKPERLWLPLASATCTTLVSFAMKPASPSHYSWILSAAPTKPPNSNQATCSTFSAAITPRPAGARKPPDSASILPAAIPSNLARALFLALAIATSLRISIKLSVITPILALFSPPSPLPQSDPFFSGEGPTHKPCAYCTSAILLFFVFRCSRGRPRHQLHKLSVKLLFVQIVLHFPLDLSKPRLTPLWPHDGVPVP